MNTNLMSRYQITKATNELIDQVEAAATPEKKIELLNQLLSVAQQTNKPLAEISTLNRLGNMWQDLGDIQRAHSYRLEAQSLLQLHEDISPANLKINIEIDLGRSYIEVRDLKNAEIHTHKALQLLNQIKKTEKREFIHCIILINSSTIADLSGENKLAIKHIKEALQKAELLDDSYLLALTYVNLATFSLNEYQINATQRYAREALAHAIVAKNPLIVRKAKMLLGGSYSRASATYRNYSYSAKAVRYFKESAQIAKQFGNPIIEVDTITELATIFSQLGKPKQAIEYFKKALQLLENIRKNLGYEGFQTAFFSSYQSLYNKMMFSSLQDAQIDQAFFTSETMRSRILLALLGRARSNVNEWSQDNRTTLQTILREYGASALSIAKATEKNTLSISPEDIIREDINNRQTLLQKKRQSFMELYEAQDIHHALWQRHQSPSPATLEDAQNLLTADEAILSYVIDHNNITIFAITKDSYHFQNLNYSSEQISTDVEAALSSIIELQEILLDPFIAEYWFNRRVNSPWPDEIQKTYDILIVHLKKLYAILIAPLLPVISNKKHLLIVPHGPLHRIPWAALHGKAEYLIQKYSISLLPSVSIGIALETKRYPKNKTTIVFGDPDPDDNMFKLPGAKQEAQIVHQLFQSEQEIFLGAKATKSNFLKHASDANLIHMSCHHLFDSTTPLLSFLKLHGGTAEDQNDDGFLFAFEIAELSLQSELVTLSACETGRNSITPGDEQYGIVRSFLTAGAQSVLSTLWHIQDQSASYFFSNFYQRIKTHGIGDSLTLTQRDMINHPSYQLPNFWAPYILSGDWRKTI
ncbi:MAG: CHAT domain-containing protein [Anaerolineae bacterium]|nr:CHAT domain-containing protein [Anaerolineae bacterium]